MGTNYYVKRKKCKYCGHTPDGIHLGKSSAGWQFSFQYNDGQYYKNVPEMMKWLKGKQITDEYGDKITNKAFWDMVKEKQTTDNANHADYCHVNYPHTRDTELNINGYSFSNCEFS